MKTTFKSTLKKVFVLLLAVGLAFSAYGCKKGGKENGGDNLTVWTANSQVKVNRYSKEAIPELEPLTIEMGKNEKEGAQIIFRAKEDIKEYQIKVSRLTCGMAFIPTSDIEIFNEKYVEITKRTSSNTAFPIGSFVPDALLPFDVAVEYGENTVKKGENQGIFVEVETKKDTPAGVYTGKATLTADGKEYVVPVSVTVWDFVVPSVPTTKNYISRFSRDHYATFEMDSTDYMDTVYFEKMLEYNMNALMPFTGVGGVEKYVELIRKYYNWEGFTAYCLYYENTSKYYKGEQALFDAELLIDYVKAIATASVEDGINYLDKALIYFYNIVDEPRADWQFELVRSIDDTFQSVLDDAISELNEELAVSNNYSYYRNVVAPTIKAIPNILAVNFSCLEELEKRGINGITPCVVIDYLDSQELRDQYAYEKTGKQLWMYTCVSPVYPYPTNHIDDFTFGNRVLSWITKKYNFDAYLNWAANDYLESNYGNPVNDPYTEATRGYTPGDGFFFYPGAKYGITGPVGSLRAVAYRDGVEDFEYLAQIEKLYEERGMSAEVFLNSIYDKIFWEVTPITDPEVFFDARREVGELLASISSDFGILYSEIEIAKGEATIEFNTVSNEAEVFYKGQKLSKQGGLYSVSVDISKETSISLEVKVNGQSKTFVKRLSGLYSVETGFEDGDISAFRVNGGSSVTVNTNSAFVAEGGKSVKIDLVGKVYEYDYQTNEYMPFFVLPSTMINGGKLAEIDVMTLAVYNDTDDDIVFTLYTFNGSQRRRASYYVAKANQWSYWNVKVSTFANIDKVKELYFMMPNIVENGEAGSATVYVDEIAFTKK